MLPDAAKDWIRDAWADLLQKEQWSQANYVFQFEKEFAAFCRRERCVAVSNGTVGLWLAARSLAQKTGARDAIVPAMTVPMVKWAMSQAGLRVREVDVERDFLISSSEVLKAVEDRERTLQAPPLVVVVWTAGIITDRVIQLIAKLKEKGVPVLEDASHAHGASFEDVKGNVSRAGQFGDLAVFSMFSSKVLSMGEGGERGYCRRRFKGRTPGTRTSPRAARRPARASAA